MQHKTTRVQNILQNNCLKQKFLGNQCISNQIIYQIFDEVKTLQKLQPQLHSKLMHLDTRFAYVFTVRIKITNIIKNYNAESRIKSQNYANFHTNSASILQNNCLKRIIENQRKRRQQKHQRNSNLRRSYTQNLSLWSQSCVVTTISRQKIVQLRKSHKCNGKSQECNIKSQKCSIKSQKCSIKSQERSIKSYNYANCYTNSDSVLLNNCLK